MPDAPRRRSDRKGRARLDRAYDRRRVHDPALAWAREIRGSGRWRKVRELVLNRSPICQGCGKRGAIDVDHIVALVELHATGRLDLAFDLGNLQSLCRRCHNRKTREETRAKGEGRPADRPPPPLDRQGARPPDKTPRKG